MPKENQDKATQKFVNEVKKREVAGIRPNGEARKKPTLKKLMANFKERTA